MKVFGVSNEMKMLIKEKADRGNKMAKKALAELAKTINGNEPQLATIDGENAVASMMAQLVNKSIEIQKSKMPQTIPFLIGGPRKVFTSKKEPNFNPFKEPISTQKVSSKIDDSLKPDTVLETAILAKKTVTGVQPADSKISPFPLTNGTIKIPELIFPDVYHPDIDPEKVTWIIDGPEETTRELNKAVIPIALGFILYFLVWS